MCFVFGSVHAMLKFCEQKKENFFCRVSGRFFCKHMLRSQSYSTEKGKVYAQLCWDSNVFLSHEGVAHSATRLPLHCSCFLPPLCGYTIGEKRRAVTVSQKTPAGWLSWRLLTSAWWYAFSRDLTDKGVDLVGNPPGVIPVQHKRMDLN